MKRVLNSALIQPVPQPEPAEPPRKRQVPLLHILASQKQLTEFDAPFDSRVDLQIDAGVWDIASAERECHPSASRPVPLTAHIIIPGPPVGA